MEESVNKIHMWALFPNDSAFSGVMRGKWRLLTTWMQPFSAYGPVYKLICQYRSTPSPWLSTMSFLFKFKPHHKANKSWFRLTGLHPDWHFCGGKDFCPWNVSLPPPLSWSSPKCPMKCCFLGDITKVCIWGGSLGCCKREVGKITLYGWKSLCLHKH